MNLLNDLVCAENTGTKAVKRFAFAPTVVKHVVKNFFGISGGAEVVEKYPFLLKKAKNEAENDSFSALFGLSDTT